MLELDPKEDIVCTLLYSASNVFGFDGKRKNSVCQKVEILNLHLFYMSKTVQRLGFLSVGKFNRDLSFTKKGLSIFNCYNIGEHFLKYMRKVSRHRLINRIY